MEPNPIHSSTLERKRIGGVGLSETWVIRKEPAVLSRCMGSSQRGGSLCFSSPTLHTGLVTFQRDAPTGLVSVWAQAKEPKGLGLD